MDPDIKIRPEFTVHKLNADGLHMAAQVAKVLSCALNDLEAVCGTDGREMAVVRTKLQEAGFFAKRAVAMRPDLQEK